jgi:hypothetical protein
MSQQLSNHANWFKLEDFQHVQLSSHQVLLQMGPKFWSQLSNSLGKLQENVIAIVDLSWTSLSNTELVWLRGMPLDEQAHEASMRNFIRHLALHHHGMTPLHWLMLSLNDFACMEACFMLALRCLFQNQLCHVEALLWTTSPFASDISPRKLVSKTTISAAHGAIPKHVIFHSPILLLSSHSNVFLACLLLSLPSCLTWACVTVFAKQWLADSCLRAFITPHCWENSSRAYVDALSLFKSLTSRLVFALLSFFITPPTSLTVAKQSNLVVFLFVPLHRLGCFVSDDTPPWHVMLTSPFLLHLLLLLCLAPLFPFLLVLVPHHSNLLFLCNLTDSSFISITTLATCTILSISNHWITPKLLPPHELTTRSHASYQTTQLKHCLSVHPLSFRCLWFFNSKVSSFFSTFATPLCLWANNHPTI